MKTTMKAVNAGSTTITATTIPSASPSRSRKASFLEQKKLHQQMGINGGGKRCRFTTTSTTDPLENLSSVIAPSSSNMIDSLNLSSKTYQDPYLLGINELGERPLDFSHSTSNLFNPTNKKSSSTSNEAEHILLLAHNGASIPQHLAIQRSIPFYPKGGSIYLFPGSSSMNFDDGYTWKEILNKPLIVSNKNSNTNSSANSMEYQLSYVASPQVSSKFQREAYHLNGYLLVYYHGDDKFVQRSKSVDRLTGIVLPPPPPAPSGPMDPSIKTSQLQWLDREDAFNKATLSTNIVPAIHSSSSSNPVYLPAVRYSDTLNTRENFAQSWYHDLAKLAEELANGKVVKNLSIFPSLQITLIHPDMTKEFETCCKLLCADPNEVTDESNNGIKLFYDTTLSFGRIYGTVLTFVNCCYEGNPVMPLAVNLHERRFKSSHQIFWARIVGDLPALQKYRFPLIIDDGEPAMHLAVKTQAPNLVQMEAWTHRFRDIDSFLRSRGYGDEAIGYYKACIEYLLHSESKQSMHDRFRKEFESVWPKDFVFYYRQRLLPRSGRLGQWAMHKMKIRDELFLCPHTNPQEEFHITCNNFIGWENMGPEQLVRAFYLLFIYYVSESSDGKVADGIFKLKRQFKAAQGYKKHVRSSHKHIPHPSQICNFILRNYPKTSAQKLHPTTSTTAAATVALASGSGLSQKWMAYGATEVFTKVGPSDPYSNHLSMVRGGTGTSQSLTNNLHSNVGEPKMEEVCDIQSTIENLIHRNNIGEMDIDSLHISNLNLNPMLEDKVHHPHSHQHYSSQQHLGNLNNINDSGSYSRNTNAQLNLPGIVLAPPSPAPNGRIFSGTSGAIGPPPLPSEHLMNPYSSSNSIVTSSAITTTSQPVKPNFPASLTTIPESVENRPTSRMDWNYDQLDGATYLPQSSAGSNAFSGLRNSLRDEYDSFEDPSDKHVEDIGLTTTSNSIPTTCTSYQNERVGGSGRGAIIKSGDNVNSSCNNRKLVTTSSSNAPTVSVSSNRNPLTKSEKKENSNGALTPSLMLWKKVQHCVVYGGSFITAARERENNSNLKHD